MSGTNLPNKDAIEELILRYNTAYDHNDGCKAGWYNELFDDVVSNIQHLLTTTANARLEQFAAELKDASRQTRPNSCHTVCTHFIDKALTRFTGDTNHE